MNDEVVGLLELADGLDVWFHEPLTEHGQRLMDALGVRVHIDPLEPRRDAQ